jgi:DNA invertase Pin-like site-specific DNA recombinase
MKCGYARISRARTSESVDALAKQPTKAGCKKVSRDVHVSGAKTDCAQLRRVIEALQTGNVFMVTRLNRLARSTRDLLNTLAAITERKAGFRSLGDAWADDSPQFHHTASGLEGVIKNQDRNPVSCDARVSRPRLT